MEKNIDDIKKMADSIVENVSRIMVDEEERVRLILSTVLAGGHVLIEDMPGTGKTMLAKTIAGSMEGSFKRIQFTPDLMPSDVTGLNVYNRKTSEFELVKGPVFADIVLADEINRATPRTQSSLLEAMEERQATIDGETIKLPECFTVIATENPLETAGTYPLPEAQMDRFMMKLSMSRGSRQKELQVMERFIDDNPNHSNYIKGINPVCTMADIYAAGLGIRKVKVGQAVREYIADIVMATRENERVKNGVSTRGALSLVRAAQSLTAIRGESFVTPDTVRYLAPFVLGHRLKGPNVIKEILSVVKVPVENWND
jgi:MoxR-like ATPase